MKIYYQITALLAYFFQWRNSTEPVTGASFIGFFESHSVVLLFIDADGKYSNKQRTSPIFRVLLGELDYHPV